MSAGGVYGDPIERGLSDLVDEGLLEMSISDDGEFTFKITDAGKAEVERGFGDESQERRP